MANKHGIFDHQSAVPSVSTPNLQSNTDTNNDSNIQRPFTVISTLLHNGHGDNSSSLNSPSSDLIQNHQINDDENEVEISSLRHEMNGVTAGDEDNDDNNHHHDYEQSNENDDNDDDGDDDEQDGINSNSLINLPQKIASILCNDNANSVSMLNDSDDNQQELRTKSPLNNLDFSQPTTTTSTQASNLSASSSTTTNLSRQSSTKLAEDFCDICQKHFCNKYYLRVNDQNKFYAF